MSGNNERVNLPSACPLCGAEVVYLTLTAGERAVAYIYPKETHRTIFGLKIRKLENVWSFVENADNVFCPKCTNYIGIEYVQPLVKHLYALMAVGRNLRRRS